MERTCVNAQYARKQGYAMAVCLTDVMRGESGTDKQNELLAYYRGLNLHPNQHHYKSLCARLLLRAALDKGNPSNPIAGVRWLLYIDNDAFVQPLHH